jgi:hypothetical protein
MRHSRLASDGHSGEAAPLANLNRSLQGNRWDAPTRTLRRTGGFWILEAADLDEALAWVKKAAIAYDVPGEVREILFYPAPEQGSGRSK